jgi:hypothetical protein
MISLPTWQGDDKRTRGRAHTEFVVREHPARRAAFASGLRAIPAMVMAVAATSLSEEA